MLSDAPWSLAVSVGAFAAAALLIAVCGVMLTARAERLADVTGFGQLLTGVVFIGAATSLSGLVVSVTAAHDGHASLAVSNSLGGIAVQTVFLALADMVYRRANLEHAAASEGNLLQATLLIVLLALPMIAMARPGLALLGVHPVSLLIVAAYLFGLRLLDRARERPMWHPRVTQDTEGDEATTVSGPHRGLVALCAAAVALALLVAGGGWVLARAAISISVHAGLEETVVGGVLTAITTSLPELVVAVAAVRRGALALAVGDILGGNAFDVLFLAASDAAYRGGSIYAAIGATDVFWVALAILLVAVLLTGLLRRERHGIGNIGFESVLVLGLYVLGVLALVSA